MSYVFDTSSFSAFFGSYYRKPFRSLWERFDALVADGSIVSTREVWRELEDRPLPALVEWEKSNGHVFPTPTAAEGAFIARIYSVRHFQLNIEQRKLLKGGKHADSFVVAKAAIEGRAVVTEESIKPNAVRIPNICQHFGVPCFSLEGFMEAEGWEF